MKFIQIVLFFALGAMAQWHLIDSLSTTCRVPAKSGVHFVINQSTGRISVLKLSSAQVLTEKAMQAVASSPQWLSISLEDRFASLPQALQDAYAQIILDTNDPLADEVIFTIAHLPVEVLTSKSFSKEIIRENAEGVYRADSILEYVEIIDSGSVGAEGDYYSTTRYRVLNNGKEELHTLPRMIYYWYVVFPKLQGELPAYVSPNDPNPTTPANGKFWRSYFWSHKESNCCALKDTMKGIKYLWANKINNPADNGALGRLSQWCNVIMPWGGHPQYRWPQPVYIYNQHSGTCSEHGWFANAAGRTALIPVTLTKSTRNDHKWNEFYDEGWIDWEPINGWIDRMEEPSHANDYWADPAKPALSGCFNWRGDGYIWGTTEHYSPVCTLAVSVTDSKGFPVDGAQIIVDADGVPGNFLTACWTGSDGRCQFLLGDDIPAFTASVKSALGSVNQTTVVRNSVAGKRYNWAPKLSSTVSELKMQKSDLLNEFVNDGEWKIEYSIDASRELVYGKHEYELYDYSFPCTFSDERQTGTVDMFICDSINFSSYTAGKSFNARIIKKDIAVADSFFTFSKQHDLWYLVLSGEKKSVNTAIANLSIRLFRSDSSAIHCKTPVATPSFSFESHGKKITLHGLFNAGEYLRLELYTLSGKRVAVLIDGDIKNNFTSITFDSGYLPGGIYFLRMSSGKYSYGTRVGIFR